jgi:hypothetical protein
MWSYEWSLSKIYIHGAMARFPLCGEQLQKLSLLFHVPCSAPLFQNVCVTTLWFGLKPDSACITERRMCACCVLTGRYRSNGRTIGCLCSKRSLYLFHVVWCLSLETWAPLFYAKLRRSEKKYLQILRKDIHVSSPPSSKKDTSRVTWLLDVSEPGKEYEDHTRDTKNCTHPTHDRPLSPQAERHRYLYSRSSFLLPSSNLLCVSAHSSCVVDIAARCPKTPSQISMVYLRLLGQKQKHQKP